MNSSATPTHLSAGSPEQANSLLGNVMLDIQDQNSSHLDHHHHHLKVHSPRVHQDGAAYSDTDFKTSAIKTEYKSNFTPFDQYVYNEITDSFVKQQSSNNRNANNPLADMRRPLSSSSSNQDLAAQSMEAHAINAASPALEAGSFEPVGGSDADSNLNSTNEPWYKEVAKRNQKANEYRLKSELGHSSALMVEPDLVRKSPLGNDPLIEAQIQDKQQQLSGYKAHEYKRDHLIAHMANNNNFKLPKEDGTNSSSSRRVVINSTSTSRPLSRTTAASRARSQSSKRPTTSAPSRPGTTTKSNQTTPTKTVPSRAPAPDTRVSTRPMTSKLRTAGTPTNGVNRSTSAATTRSATSTTASSRVSPSKPVSTLRSAKAPSADISSKPINHKAFDSTATRRVARTSAPDPVSKSPMKRAVTASSTSSRTTTSSARPTTGLTNRTAKPASGPSPAGAVKSIKTKALVNAGQKASTEVLTSHVEVDADPKLIGLRPGSDFIQALDSSVIQDAVANQTLEKDSVEKDEFNNSNTDLIFSTTRAGNMLADEIAQAEKVAHETVLKEKLESDDKATVSSVGLPDQPKLERPMDTLTAGSVPKQLVNGLEEGLVSEEDRYESSERDASLESKSQFNEPPAEQHDQSYEHEPYSIIPTTYATKDEDGLSSNDESVVDRGKSDIKDDYVNSTSSQKDVSSPQEGSNLLLESTDEIGDETHESAQDIEQKLDASIPQEKQSNETTKILLHSDDSDPNLLHPSDSRTDEQASNQDLQIVEDFPDSTSANSKNTIQTSLEVANEATSELNDESVTDQKDAPSESLFEDHGFPKPNIEEKNSEFRTKLENDKVSNSELHSGSPQQMGKIDINSNNDVKSDTVESDLSIETVENLEAANRIGCEIPDEMESDADRGDEMNGQKDAITLLPEQLNLMEQPNDVRSNLQTDLDKVEDHPRGGDIDSNDETFVDKNELLMNVVGLEAMESMKRQEMSQKSELARKQSESSTLLAGQPMSELVLSVNQLDEYFAHVSPHQGNEVPQQAGEENKNLDQMHDPSKDGQHVDQSSDSNEPKSNLPGSVRAVAQPMVDSSKEPTSDLLNFGSITPVNDEQPILIPDVSTQQSTVEGQDNENESKTFDKPEVNRQSSGEDSRRSVPSEGSLSDSGEDIRVDPPKHSDSATNLETVSNQATKSTTSALEDEMDEDEQLKLSNHLTNSDDDVILEPRNRKDSLSEAFSPQRSTSSSRYNEGAGLGIMAQDDEELCTLGLSDGSSAHVVAPTVAEISTSKSLMPEIAQASNLMHPQKLIQENVFDDDDDEGYDLNPLADPIDVAATMSPSSSVAEELLRLSRQNSLNAAISELSETPINGGSLGQGNEMKKRENVEDGNEEVQKNPSQPIERSGSSPSSPPAQNPDSKNKNTALIDVSGGGGGGDGGDGDDSNNDRLSNQLNDNETKHVDT